ncbi:MAG TPA: UbiA family prenyltransferase, partial [Phycisphaerales bacterium]|nr:UbiA family prenyltransferase [Phycisphaerales bacterium]
MLNGVAVESAELSGTRISRGRAVMLALSDIKLAHSVFAMPLAVLGAFLAAPVFRSLNDAGPVPQALGPKPQATLSTFLFQLLLIIACMFFARTWAMLVNRLADWKFDRENPRTARRAIASGRLAPRAGLLVALGCAACFVGACSLFWAL